jgi:ketosteroid isomerase-like protein
MFTRMKFLVILAGLALASSSSFASGSGGSSSASPDTAKVKAAIQAANARSLDAFKRGDKAGMMANYTSDAIVMAPNEEAWRGPEGLDKGFSGLLSQFSFKDGAVTTTDVMVAGDLAVETGTFALTLQPKTGAEIKDKGKYLTVWKRQPDGTWKIVRDINNSDLPAPK